MLLVSRSYDFLVRTSISWTVQLHSLFALKPLTIAFNATRVWSILQIMVLRIFHSLMVPSMLLVSRSYDFSSALINVMVAIVDYYIRANHSITGKGNRRVHTKVVSL